MQGLRTLIRKVVFLIINALFGFKLFRSLINLIYNQSTWENKRIFTNHLKQPNKDFYWKIKLLNGESLMMFVDKDDHESFNLALLYHNISPQLCILENDIEKFLNKDSVYFDIGANQGMRSFLMLAKDRQTYMFEPNSYLNSINKKRCVLNNFKNYSIEQICLSNQIGKQDFYFSKEHSMSSLERESAEIKGVSQIETVDILTLDSYIKENNISTMYPFIKIDVEGHEMAVLKGAEETIKTLYPTMLIEIFELTHIKKAFKIFSSLNYKVFGINFGSENILTEVKTIDALETYQASDYLFVYQKEIIKGLIEKHF